MSSAALLETLQRAATVPLAELEELERVLSTSPHSRQLATAGDSLNSLVATVMAASTKWPGRIAMTPMTSPKFAQMDSTNVKSVRLVAF